MTALEREQAYLARRIVRNANPEAYMRKRGAQLNSFVLAMVKVMPELLETSSCIAVADARAVAMCGGSPNRFDEISK